MPNYRMRSLYFLSLFVFVHCTINVQDIQTIEISDYSDPGKNEKLASELLYYSPEYFAFNIPSYNSSTSSGIKMSMYTTSSNENPFFRINYDKTNSSIVENIDSLKLGFDEFIPQLSADHVAHQEAFSNLKPEGEEWFKNFFITSAEEILKNVSEELQSQATPDQVEGIKAQISQNFGELQHIEFLRPQYYRSFSIYPESIALFYDCTFSSEKKIMTKINFIEKDGQWLVLAFSFTPVY